jgi:hypothetical protein
MTLFANLTSDGLEESQDRLGGFAALETGTYTGKIKAAYAGKSDGGAHNVTLILDFEGREYRETLYITNKKGENFFVKDGKKIPLPGFTVVDDICLVTIGTPLSEQTTEEKVVKLYDRDAKKELPKSVDMLTGLLGQTVTLGILNQLVNQTEKNSDGVYVPKSDGSTRNQNVIDKVFHTETKMTVAEARHGSEEAKFYVQWKERNDGKTQDRREQKEGGNAGSTGAPKRPSGPPQAGGQASERKAMFPPKK